MNESHKDKEIDLETKVERMLEMQNKLHENTLANIQKVQLDQKQQYDAKHNTHTKLKVGYKVLVESKKNEGQKGGKLEINFKGGPYTIAQGSPQLYLTSVVVVKRSKGSFNFI